MSPARQRLIDDMNMRRFSRETQRNYLRDIIDFGAARGLSFEASATCVAMHDGARSIVSASLDDPRSGKISAGSS
jgi:hypothetical protein